MTRRKRAHHYIPEFHLAQFIGYPGRREFGVFDKKWGKFARRPVATSAVYLDYYAVPGATPDERLRVEDEFARLENQVAPLIVELANLPVGAMVGLDGSDRQALAEYAATLHVRVPAWRDQAMARAVDLTTDLGALGLDDPQRFLARARAGGIAGTDDDLERQRATFAADIQTGRRAIKVSNAASLVALTPAVGKGAPLLVERHWELLRMDEWPGLVLGDQPVSLFSAGRLAPSIGFGTAGVQVMMPLSPKVLLVVDDRPREALLRVVSARYPSIREPWWAVANKVAWLTSQRYVFAQNVGHLEATEALIPEEFRRRDLRELDPDEEAAMRQRDRQQRVEWRRQGLL